MCRLTSLTQQALHSLILMGGGWVWGGELFIRPHALVERPRQRLRQPGRDGCCGGHTAAQRWAAEHVHLLWGCGGTQGAGEGGGQRKSTREPVAGERDGHGAYDP